MISKSKLLKYLPWSLLLVVGVMVACQAWTLLAPLPGDETILRQSAALDNDKRAAVMISINLSLQLVTAVLALFGVETAFLATFFTYLLNRYKKIGTVTILAALLSVLCIFMSAWNAGTGITNARNAGFHGNWNLEAGGLYFDAQAGLAFCAIITFLSMLVFSALETYRFHMASPPKDQRDLNRDY